MCIELKNLGLSSIEHKYDEKRKLIIIMDKIANLSLDLSKSFPFEPPKIKIEMKEPLSYYCLYDLKKVSFVDIMKEHWHPSIKLVDIAEKTVEFTKKNTIKLGDLKHSLTSRIHLLGRESQGYS